MSGIIKNQAEQIQNYFMGKPWVRGVVALGSYASQELDEYSDLS